ncbi:MAG: hypothetical protein MPN21_21610 [Thermoanaerobaculia bacterium]|nr:hypothetical protein [Thermoanaerobaculia bacterium]
MGRCAVVAAANADGLTKPYAFVVAAEDAECHDLERRLQEWTLERLDPYKHPRRIILVEELPTTHLGKIDRGALKRRLS